MESSQQHRQECVLCSSHTSLTTSLGKTYTNSSNQSVTWPQVKAFSYTDVKAAFWSSKWGSHWGRRGDLSDFELSLVVGARPTAGLSISQNADTLESQPSPVGRRRHGLEKRSGQQSCGGTCLVVVRGQRSGWTKRPESIKWPQSVKRSPLATKNTVCRHPVTQPSLQAVR